MTTPAFWRSLVLVLCLLIGVAAVATMPAVSATTAGALALVGIVGISVGIWRIWERHPYLQASPHLIIAAALSVSATDLCASGCGSFTIYATVIGWPTAVVGAFFHIAVAILLATTRSRAWMPAWLLDACIAIMAGASLFYADVMAETGAYCRWCAVAHTLMVIQFMQVLRARTAVSGGVAVQRALMVAAAFAAFGFLSTSYHAGLPRERDSSGELMAYLRSMGLAGPPGASAAPDVATWGEPTAPAVATIVVEPRCTHCANQLADLTHLGQAVADGRLRVRFVAATSGARSDAFRAAGLLVTGRGLEIARAFVDPAVPTDRAIPAIATAAGIDPAVLIAATTDRRATLDRLAAEADDLLRIHGIDRTPTTIVTTPSRRPRVLAGFTPHQRLTAAFTE